MSGKEETTYGSLDEFNRELSNHLIGKLATLADASIENERQVEAFKDILKSTIWENEHMRSCGTRIRLLSCRKAGVPLLPDWAEKAASIEMGS